MSSGANSQLFSAVRWRIDSKVSSRSPSAISVIDQVLAHDTLPHVFAHFPLIAEEVIGEEAH